MKFSRILNIFYCCLILFFCAQAHVKAQAHVLVFVHLGTSLPPYLEDAVYQASLFNYPQHIYVIANAQALEKPNNIWKFANIIEAEKLQMTERHLDFRKNSTLDKTFNNSFWFLTSERFLYLDDFMQQYDIKDLFHIENDVALYVDLAELLPVLHESYKSIAAVFDNDNRCIPSFIYAANKDAMANLAGFMSEYANLGGRDMEILGLYKNMHPEFIKNLPIIPASYKEFYALESRDGQKTQNPANYSLNIDKFKSIFDAAALGQYLGGTDAQNGNGGPGFINASCLFNPANFKYEVQVDDYGRLVPYISFNGTRYRINNLHIHSKNLKPFLSTAFFEIKYKFTNDPIDVVIPCIKKDMRTLELAISGIKKNCANIRNVFIISPENLSENAIWIDEKSFPFTFKDIAMQLFNNDETQATEYLKSKDSRIGWIFQQLLKFYAPFVIPGISENVLILDADTVFLKPVDFQDKSSGAPLFNPSPEYYPPYFEHASKVIPGFYKISKYSGVSHHMLFQKCVLSDLFEVIRKANKAEPWIALIKNIDAKDLAKSGAMWSGISEYEIYFNFLFARNSQAKIRPLKWAESGDLNKLQTYKDQGYDYVSFHSNYPVRAEFRHFGADDL